MWFLAIDKMLRCNNSHAKTLDTLGQRVVIGQSKMILMIEGL